MLWLPLACCEVIMVPLTNEEWLGPVTRKRKWEVTKYKYLLLLPSGRFFRYLYFA